MTSVVIPVFNGESVLSVTVPAVLRSAGVREWVWVDDGSTDGTASVLQRLTADVPRARVVRLPRNRGRSAARNAGIRESTGGTIVFFDADVEPPADAAGRLAGAAEQDGAVAAVARIEPVLDDTSDPYQDYLARFPRGPGEGLSEGAPLDWRFFLSGACALRRSALVGAGLFDQAIGYGEDVALACRLADSASHGLRLAEVAVRLHDVGRLTDALSRAEAFGRGLLALSPQCRQRALGRRAAVPGVSLAARLAEPGLAQLVGRLGAGPARRRAVRYLLAARILSAPHRA